MSNKKMDWYIENNDFEGAVERLETTSARWKKSWYQVCATIFEACGEWAKKYVLCPAENAVKKVSQVLDRKSKYQSRILKSSDCNYNFADVKGIEKCYLFEFFDKNGKSICSKVGTTTRKVVQRLREELNSNTYIQMGAETAVIHRVYDCGEIPAEGLESYFRAAYIKKFPESFKKNDRFINAKFDLAEADKIAAKYLELVAA